MEDQSLRCLAVVEIRRRQTNEKRKARRKIRLEKDREFFPCGVCGQISQFQFCETHLEEIKIGNLIRRKKELSIKFPEKLWEKALECFLK